jgi:hypothetical protein
MKELQRSDIFVERKITPESQAFAKGSSYED